MPTALPAARLRAWMSAKAACTFPWFRSPKCPNAPPAGGGGVGGGKGPRGRDGARGADEDAIAPRHLQNALQRLDAGTGFDLQQHANVVMYLARVLGLRAVAVAALRVR